MMLFIVFFLITVVGPVVFWFWIFIRQDRAEPEPKKTLIKSFFWGIGAAIFAIGVEGTIFFLLFSNQYIHLLKEDLAQVSTGSFLEILALVFLAGVIEEIIKFFVLKQFIYAKTDFNQIADGVFYAVALALGFSFFENIFYFYDFFTGMTTTGFIVSASVRGIVTTLLHLTATGIIGYALGRMKFSIEHKKSTIIKFILLAILLHGFFNILVSLPYGSIFAFVITLLVLFYLINILKKPETRLVWKLNNPQGSKDLKV